MTFTNYEIPMHGVRLPTYKLSKEDAESLGVKEDIDHEKFLRLLCEKGLNEKIETGLIEEGRKKEYEERIDHEIGVISEGGFVDYILITADLMGFCKKEGIATNFGRGSAVGSMVCFLTGITRVIDPIKENLYFERFISAARLKKQVIDGVTYVDGSMVCDIDCDIDSSQRDKVIKYLFDAYPNKVCKLSTVTTLTSKVLMKECGKIVKGHSEQTMKEVSDMIPSIFGKVQHIRKTREESEDFNKFCKENEDVYKIALKLNGLIKNASSHASGYLLSYYDLYGFLPVQNGTNGEVVSSYDMADSQKLAIKLDILGLSDLQLNFSVCKRVGVDPDRLNFDDEEVYKNLQKFDAPFGLFQLGCESAYRALKKIKPRNFQHLMAVLAIIRPGCFVFTDQYARYVETGDLESIDPHLDKIFGETAGVVLFQESLMKCAKEIFGFSLQEAEGVRRACSKKKKEEMEKYKDTLFSQAEKLNLPRETAEKFWELLIASADYSFNKCLEKNTIVKTDKGANLIAKVRKGDKVLGYNIKSGENEFVVVKDVHISKSELFEFDLSDGRSIRCSMDHKFLTKEVGMMPIKDIINNDYSILLDEKQEYFKDVIGYEGFYKISNKGTLISLLREVGIDGVGSGVRDYGGGIIGGEMDKDGYRRAWLYKGHGKKKRQKIHDP